MIDIKIEPLEFSYDIQSMIQAFYMGHPFKINRKVESSYRILKVKYEKDNIKIELYDKEKKLFDKCLEADCSLIFDRDNRNEADRRNLKNALKKLLYGILQKDTGVTLPWGNLTGIRPTKIPEMMLEEHICEEKIKGHMKEEYLISDNKLNLAMEIAKTELNVLSGIDYKKGYSLYVGIPFCPTTCLYCSFTSYPIHLYQDKVDDYVSALIKEIEFLGKKLKGRILNTVYIGGGTPTTLNAIQLDRLIRNLKKNFDFGNVVEFTVEAGRPDSITKDKLDVLKEHCVTRISINPQTMNQKTLDIIGRKHTVEQVVDAFKLARKVGFDNINMDFIVGLPDEDRAMVVRSMKAAKELNPDGITIHSLAIKRASRLNIQKEKYKDVSLDNDTVLMNVTSDYAKEMGMIPYYLYRQKNMSGNQENVGYSKPGKEGIYNILMMGDFQDVWAVGAGAVTKLLSKDRKKGQRIDTVKNVDQYIERIDEMIGRKAAYFENNSKRVVNR